jgi:hypothetical protein
MDHPQPYSDTDPRMMEVWIDLLRKQSLGDKLKTVLTMAGGGHMQRLVNLRKRFPKANRREILEHITALKIGEDVQLGSMSEDSRNLLPDGFRRLLAAIDRLEIQYFVGGSAASSTWGHARFTQDVDLVVALALDNVEEFAAELTKEEFYADVGLMREGIQHHRAFNVMYQPFLYKFDLFPLQDDAYSRSQLNRRQFTETNVLGEPIECAMASPEDVILSKLRWFRLGGETSQQQWIDLKGVVQVRGPKLDLNYLHEWAPKLKVADLLERLLGEAK